METDKKVASSNRRILYLVGAIAAFIAVIVFRRNLAIELTTFGGFGIFAVPTAAPLRAQDWFALLVQDAPVGLLLLNLSDLLNYVLIGLLFSAVCAALWQANRGMALTALLLAWAGALLYALSNQAFSILSLSRSFAAALTDTQRETLLAAGEALLAIDNPGRVISGTGALLSLFLFTLAGLLFSICMLRSAVFSRATGWLGLLASLFQLLYFPALTFAPALIAVPPVLSAPLREIWYVLIALRLLKLRHN